jgi:lipoprotein-anchoring transpeptidase ErfK/SrfK
MRISKGLLGLLFLLTTVTAYSRGGMPSQVNSQGERFILVDPRVNAFGAYDENGTLVHSGVASTGKNWCADIGRSCHTHPGSFRIYYMGDSECISSRFPIPTGGAPMPFCMYFNGNQALHGSPNVGYAHLSHGCVRLRVSDARWLRYNFAETGTLVIVQSY